MTSNQTQTIFQDVIISLSRELTPNRRRIRKFLNLDLVANFLQNLLPPPPLKNSASFMVLFGRGGRRAQRRVGYWHQIADQVNTTLGISGEVVQTTIAHSPVVGGRAGRRPRRTGPWPQTSNQTQTIFTDVAIGVSQMRAFRRWLRKFFNWDLPAANRILNYPMTIYAGTATIFDYVYDPTGKPVIGINVTVQLALASGIDTAQVPNVLLLPAPQTVNTDRNGYWQATVIPNPQIQPGSNYTVEIEGAITYKVNVPDQPGPFQTSTILS